MAELKTKPTKESVTKFIDDIPDEKRRKDCRTILKLMREITGAKPEMWGTSIIGFGRLRYKSANGQENDWMIIGFSPRKNDLTLYLMTGFRTFADLLSRLGKHKTGKACLYIKKLDDVDLDVLRELVRRSVDKISSHSLDQLRAGQKQ